MKRKQSIITILIIAMVASFNIWSTDKHAGDPEFKNLQILPKDISKESLDKVMDSFTEALNVKCGFCHVRNQETKKMEFEKDDNPHKAMAREMMKMTMAINAQYFDVDIVTNAASAPVHCYTCHQGEKIPLVAPKPIPDSLKAMELKPATQQEAKEPGKKAERKKEN